MGLLRTFRKVRCIVVEEESTAQFKKIDSAGTFAFTQTAYLLKLVIPTTNALPRWRLNVETKKKRTLHSSRWLIFNP
jgi:hypothetical protein